MWVPYDPDLAEIGAIEPEFVEEFDYHATKRIVHDHDIEVGWISEIGSEYPVQALSWHYEDCDINVYKTVLKWRSTISDIVEGGIDRPVTVNGERWDPTRGLPLRNEWR